MERGNELDHLQDRIYELEAEKRDLVIDLEEQEKLNEDLRYQLQEAYQELADQSGNRVVTVRGSDEEDVYYASRSRSRFHRPKCEWAKCIPERNLIEFGSHAEAVQAGFRPCMSCKA